MDVNLVLFKKDGSRKVFPLPSSVTIIGRRRDCDLQIPLMDISKRHCQLNHDEGVLKVRDLGSRNGTFLNGKRINEAVVQPGDYISIGPVTLGLQIDGQPRTIDRPGPAGQNLLREDAPAEDKKADTADEQFGSFPELDELDSADEAD